MIDAAEKNDRIDVEKERIAAQKEIAGLQVGAKVATDRANLSAKEQMEGLRMGVEIAREAASVQNPPVSPEPAAPKESE